jgi:hypothetical protein
MTTGPGEVADVVDVPEARVHTRSEAVARAQELGLIEA